MFRRSVVGMVVCLALAGGVAAQPQLEEKVPVEIVAYADDMVGQRFVYQIKEGIRSSNALQLSFSDSSRFQLIVRTMDKDDEHPNNSALYCVIWNIIGPQSVWPVYLNSTLGYCGANRTKDAAETIVAETDELVTNLQKIYSGK